MQLESPTLTVTLETSKMKKDCVNNNFETSLVSLNLNNNFFPHQISWGINRKTIPASLLEEFGYMLNV